MNANMETMIWAMQQNFPKLSSLQISQKPTAYKGYLSICVSTFCFKKLSCNFYIRIYFGIMTLNPT